MTWAFQKVTVPAQGVSASITVAQGTVTLTDIASKSVAGLPNESWGVLINWKHKAWVFGYEGGNGSTLCLEVDNLGNLHPTGQGTMTEIKYTK